MRTLRHTQVTEPARTITRLTETITCDKCGTVITDTHAKVHGDHRKLLMIYLGDQNAGDRSPGYLRYDKDLCAPCFQPIRDTITTLLQEHG